MAQDGRRSWRKTALSTIVGGLVGAGAMAAMLSLAGTALLDAMGPSRVALAAVGLIYLLIAAMVGFGVAAPRAGAKVLNVADAEELRDDRANLLFSTIVMALLGATLLLLALARGPGFAAGVVSAGVAFATLALMLAGGALASWLWRDRFDELGRQLGLEGASWSFYVSWIVLTVWGAADFLGLGATLTAIDAVTVSAAALLLGSFVAIGRRGMMVR
ncbi:hypothetical protein [Sphingopyxis sp. KK2]|uniref:hypothetical protein n=1 Tax=Sphingopyxis sp. KK2 TaxID=1855727 RepID=UPI001181B8A8|nr:hypothetical protein [Sphingopyxis sp. KK2]